MYYDWTPAVEVSTNSGTWLLISLIVAIIGGISVFFTFLGKSNENKFKGFLGWMYDFLHFKITLADVLLKITYLIAAIYITLASFDYIGTNFGLFILMAVVGNVVLRLCYEFMLVILVICKNTTEINKKLKTPEKQKKEEKE